MTVETIARVKGVSHRYGATVSLDDVSIDIPARIMVGVIGPDGVGKSTLLGLIAGREDNPERRGRRLRQDHRQPRRPCARSAAASPICRKGSAAISIRRSPYSRTSTSSAACSDCRRRSVAPGSRASYGHEPGEVRGAPRGQALRRHEAEAEPLLRADQRPRPSHPRRADDRRRSPVARPVLGPHQLDPRAPPADERDGRHRLYGRSRALRLADGDGRRQDHRHRDAEGAAR